MAELDERHWWYRARRKVLAELIRREARPPAKAQGSSRSAAAPATISRCSASSAEVDALELDDEARALAEKAARPQVMSAPLPELAGVRTALRPDRRVRRDRAYRRRQRRARLDRSRLKPGGKLVMTGPGAPVDVVGARRRQPPQAALFEAR
jgi:hypothetical protein